MSLCLINHGIVGGVLCAEFEKTGEVFGSAKLQQIKNEFKRILFIVIIDSHNRARTYLFINRNTIQILPRNLLSIHTQS